MLATVHSSYYKRCPLGAGIIPDFLMNVPLTVLSEDELLFRDSCRSFAEERMRPLVRKMDEEARLDDSAIPDLLQLGLMRLQMAGSCGLRTPPKQTSSSCLKTPIRSRVTKGSPRFWLNAIFQDSPSGKRKINWASALRAPAN